MWEVGVSAFKTCILLPGFEFFLFFLSFFQNCVKLFYLKVIVGELSIMFPVVLI